MNCSSGVYGLCGFLWLFPGLLQNICKHHEHLVVPPFVSGLGKSCLTVTIPPTQSAWWLFPQVPPCQVCWRRYCVVHRHPNKKNLLQKRSSFQSSAHMRLLGDPIWSMFPRLLIQQPFPFELLPLAAARLPGTFLSSVLFLLLSQSNYGLPSQSSFALQRYDYVHTASLIPVFSIRIQTLSAWNCVLQVIGGNLFNPHGRRANLQAQNRCKQSKLESAEWLWCCCK